MQYEDDVVICHQVHENALFSHRRHDELARNYFTEYYRVREPLDLPTLQQEFIKTVPEQDHKDQSGRFNMEQFIDFLIRTRRIEIIDFDGLDFNPDTGLVEYITDLG